MILQLLKEWNPWWEDTKLLENIKGKPRQMYEHLIKSSTIREITIISGIRRSGKSTLMYEMIDSLLKQGIRPNQILFINFEDKKLFEIELDKIYDEYRSELNPDKKAFIFLDEIHKTKGWESWIRKKYDIKSNDKFIISGSCSYLLNKEYSTLLTGRNIVFEVFPLSFKEYLDFQGMSIKNTKLITDNTKYKIINHLNTYFELGGFPEVFLKEDMFKQKLLEQYFDDILYKDIIERYNLNVQKTRDLALFFMSNFTEIISLRNIRSSLGLSYDTAKDYISYFKEALLFFTCDHFSYSYKEQKAYAPKIYCADTGIRNAVSFKFSKEYGKLAENLVFIELKRKGINPYYWTGKKEVDFIVKEKDNSLTAINVTYTDDVDKREVEGLLEFSNLFKKTNKLIILTKDIEKKEKNILFIPLWKWLLS